VHNPSALKVFEDDESIYTAKKTKTYQDFTSNFSMKFWHRNVQNIILKTTP